MKKSFTTGILIAALVVAVNISPLSAQTSTPRYTDMVEDNPSADGDIKIVSDYLNTLLVDGNVDQATSLLAPGFMDYGPGPEDSADLQKTIDTWKQNATIQQNRKVNFVATTFNVKDGGNAGHWVSTWGTYSWTQNGKDLKLPFQYTAHLTGGKIDKDIVYYDPLYIMQKLGYTVTPPSN